MDLGKNIQQSIDVYLKNFGLLFGAGLVAVLLTTFTFGILAGPIMGGFFILALKVIRGENGEFAEIFAHFDKFTPTFIASLICFVPMVIISMIPVLKIIANIFFNPLVGFAWSMAIIKIIENNLEPLDAVKEGIEMIKTNPLMIWLYSLILGILSVIGIIAFLVGILVTAQINTVGMAVAYENMTKISKIASEGPTINT